MPTLDKSQRAFCESDAKNIRLLAPAGCGKTLCLLHRCLYLARQMPDRRQRFLIVTFTRAARDELVGRISADDAYSDIRDAVEVTTLNAWGYRRIKNVAFRHRLLTSDGEKHFAMENQLQTIWRKYKPVEDAITAKKRRFGTNPTRDLMNVLDGFKSLGFDHVRHSTVEAFSEHWELLVSQGLEWRLEQLAERLTQLDVLERSKTDPEKLPSLRVMYNRFFRFWREAVRHLTKSATFTIEDQKYYAYLDEQSNLERGSYLSGAASYDHIFVDEFQDINPLDVALVKAIADRNRATLTIAGDDDQAIFEWRGATPEYILTPDQHLGRVFKTCILAVNYRSPANIVHHSQQLIANNERRELKAISSHDVSASNQAVIEVRTTPSLSSALEFASQLVHDIRAGGQSPSRIALIGRLRSQIIPFQIHFASQDIPFCAAEDLQIFLSEAFDSLLHLMSLKEKSSQRQSTSDAVRDTLDLCDLVGRYKMSWSNREALRAHLVDSRPRSVNEAVTRLARDRGATNIGRLKNPLLNKMADSIARLIFAKSVSGALDTLSTHFEGLQQDFIKAETDIFYKDPPFLHLSEFALKYEDDFDRFVDDIERAKDTLVYVPPFDDESEIAVIDHPLHLMTASRAKGKEFDTVVILDANDRFWPTKHADTDAKLEEERRLFYVAFTRARKHLAMLVNPEAEPSPFVSELKLPE